MLFHQAHGMSSSYHKKSKGSGLFLQGLPSLANEAVKLNYPFNRRNLRGITFYQHEKEAKPYWISPVVVASAGKLLRKYAGHNFAKHIGQAEMSALKLEG